MWFSHIKMIRIITIHADTKQLADILRSANLRQHAHDISDRHGHIMTTI